MEMVPAVIAGRFTRLLIPSWEGGRDVHLGPRIPFPSLGFTDAGVGGNHILYDPKEKYVKLREVRLHPGT